MGAGTELAKEAHMVNYSEMNVSVNVTDPGEPPKFHSFKMHMRDGQVWVQASRRPDIRNGNFWVGIRELNSALRGPP